MPGDATPTTDPHPERAVRAASWIDPAVVYGMVIRNFTSEGFRGAAARMDELAELGVAAIWLAPINRTPEGDFGYAVTDYLDVRPEYGTIDDFRALVDAAHARGIRVLMDVVPNHTSHLHPWSVDAAAYGAESPYHAWYDRGEDGDPTFYFNWEHLPNLNYDDPEVRRTMTGALAFWIRECGVDGYRVDVAWGIRQRRPDFWPACIAELRAIDQDALLIAEASARDPYYAGSGFDAAYDWTDQLGEWAWTEAFRDGPVAPALREALTRSDPATRVFRFLNNNDTGDRFIMRHGVAAYRAALAMLLTLPGLPCLFTGDEVGAEYKPYETDREIDWTDRHELRPFVRKLIALRREVPPLHSPKWELLDVAPADRVLAYRRMVEGGGEALVAINLSAEPVEVALPELAGTIDLLDGEPVTSGPLALPGWGFRVIGTVAS